MKQLNRNPLTQSISLALLGSAVAATLVVPAYAEEDETTVLEEVIVSAQKRDENLQDVAVSIQVLGNQMLENLDVRSFADYIDYLPSVSFTAGGGPGGPGFGQVYMRGITSGGDGNHSASMPSVGYYLDEQPVTTINQVLDIYMYDIARVESLPGPQGTLYGQGSQAGTIRVITNKPEMGVNTGGYDLEINTVKSGDVGYDMSGFWNIPIGERAAIRLVAWYQDTGGYIDQVPTTMYFPGPKSHEINNSDFTGKNQNTTKKTGMRALLKIDLNDNWSVTPGFMAQNADNKGYWEHNPEFFGDLETGRLWPAAGTDDWYQASLTLDGKIGNIDMVYAGAYLDRDQNYQYDYSDYTEYWAYYLTNPNDYDPPGYCVYYSDRWDDATDYYECAVGTQYVDAKNNFTRNSHELRFQSAADQRFRWVGGLFYQKQKHDFDLQWTVPDVDSVRSVVEGGHVVWQTYQIREDRDKAIFGEVSYDLTEKFTLTGGARYFKYDNTLYGFNGFLRHCTGQYIDGKFVEIPADEGGEIQYPCFNTRILDGEAKGNDWAFKGNLEYRIDEDKLLYFTYSEGFRAGGTNRARVEGLEEYKPDFVYNYEIGWKTTLAGGSVRFNGAAYIVDWKDFQFGFLDFDISNLTIVQNVGDARTKGVEWDLTWAANENNTVSFSGSYNDAKLQNDFWRNPADEGDPDVPYNAPKGTPMPYVPKLQLTGIWRANFTVGDFPAFFQTSVSYTGSRWNDLDTLNYQENWDYSVRQKMDAYTLVNLSTGIERDNWSLSLFVNNVFDERAVINIVDPGYGGLENLQRPPGHAWTTTTNRPRFFALRWTQRF